MMSKQYTMVSSEQKCALLFLKTNKYFLSKQQYQTIKGQILAGDTNGAIKGINKLIGVIE